MSLEKISINDARKIMINAQGLGQPPKRPAEKKDVLDSIRRMRVLQIDTINVVARSPYLVLWSRLGDYNPDWLNELLAEGTLFEYWAHAMCFIPIEDFPLYRRFMLDGLRAWGDAAAWVNNHSEVAAMVMERIRREGGLRSADFENNNKPAGGWWNWKDEKTALECLFILGELMVARRQSFQRVYDLPSRVNPDWDGEADNSKVPGREDVLKALTLKAMEALGVALAEWVPDYFRLPKTGNLNRLETLAEEGLLRRVEIEDFPKPAYLHPKAIDLAPVSHTTLLSPFDPLVWDRKRLKDLFDFDYTIEVYTPAPKRRFGYFTLPILHNGSIVGRIDPKAHRADGLFEVKSIYLESGVALTDDLLEGLRNALYRLAAWHNTPEVVVRRSEPAELAERLIQ